MEVIDEPIYEQLEGWKTVELKLNHLLSLKYTEDLAHVFKNEIKRLSQHMFPTINIYFEVLSFYSLRIGICKGETAEKIKERTQDLFLEGLAKETRREMSKMMVKGFTPIFERIKEGERELEEEIKQSSLVEVKERGIQPQSSFQNLSLNPSFVPNINEKEAKSLIKVRIFRILVRNLTTRTAVSITLRFFRNLTETKSTSVMRTRFVPTITVRVMLPKIALR